MHLICLYQSGELMTGTGDIHFHNTLAHMKHFGRAAVNGIATIAVKSTKKTGTITVNADSPEGGLAGSTATITTTPGSVRKLRYKIY